MINERILFFHSHLLLFLYLSRNNWIVAIDSFQGNISVPIMTIHKSKGLEFNVVFFVGLSRSKRPLYFTFSENRFGRRRTNSDIAVLYQMLEESKVVEEKYIVFELTVS